MDLNWFEEMEARIPKDGVRTRFAPPHGLHARGQPPHRPLHLAHRPPQRRQVHPPH